MRKGTRHAMAAAIILASTLAAHATAAPLQPQQQNEGPCANDMQTLCPDAHTRGKIVCLTQNRDKISPACSKMLGAKIQAVKEKCAKDAAAICPRRKLTNGELVSCLRQNKDRASTPCRQAMNAMTQPIAQPQKNGPQ